MNHNSEVVADLDAAFEMANKWREVSGQEGLTVWIPSVPEDSENCLLARAFNKYCRVDYNEASIGGVILTVGENAEDRAFAMASGTAILAFTELEDAQLFADTFGLDINKENKISSAEVSLPDEIGLVAYEYDQGEYSQFIEPLDEGE